MAQPLAFKEANTIYWPPAGMENDVVPLHIRRLDGALASCWRLSEEEKAEVAKTGVVWLLVLGHGMPPVMVHGQKAQVV